MKTRLILLVFLVVPFFVWGQEDLKSEQIEGVEYIIATVAYNKKIWKDKFVVSWMGKEDIGVMIKGADGKPFGFGNNAVIFNYFHKNGYEFVCDMGVKKGEELINIIDRFLFKKK